MTIDPTVLVAMIVVGGVVTITGITVRAGADPTLVAKEAFRSLRDYFRPK